MGLALHGLALLAVLAALPQTLAAGRYTLAGEAGKGVPPRIFAIGAAGLALAVAASWIELRRPPRGTAGALLRRAFVALVAAWLWAVFPQQELIVARPQPGLAAVVAALVFSAACLAAALSPARARGLGRALDLGLTSVAVALVALEVGLQVGSRLGDSPLLARVQVGDADLLLRAMRMTPGEPHLGGRTNTLGYVDDEFPAIRERPRRVVSIGDSFSTGVVPHPFHYTTVAEGLLGDTEILNIGVPGIGPVQYRLLLEDEGLGLTPDLIMVQLFAGNDLEEYGVVPPSHTWDWMERRNVMLYLVSHRLRAILRERSRAGVDADQVARSLGRELEAGLAARELERALPHLVDPLLERPSYSPERFLAIEVQRARLLGGPAQEPYAELRRRLDLLLDSAGDVPLALGLIPDEFQVDDALWAEVLAAAGGEELERERFQRVVHGWAQERGVPVCDLLPDLRAAAPWSDGRPHLYHLRDTHFNARGNRAAGESVARFLAGILPSPSGVSER